MRFEAGNAELLKQYQSELESVLDDAKREANASAV